MTTLCATGCTRALGDGIVASAQPTVVFVFTLDILTHAKSVGQHHIFFTTPCRTEL